MEGHLYYKEGKIHISEELESDEAFQALKKKDKHAGKPNYEKWLTYLYFVHDMISPALSESTA